MRIQQSVKIIQNSYTLGIDTGIYAVDDLMGVSVALGTSQPPRGVVVIQSVSIIDKDLQNSALIVGFTTDSTATIGTNNNPISIPDGSMRSVIRGCVAFAGADYKATASNSIATKSNLNIVVNPSVGLTPGFFVLCKGTPTYSSVSSLIVKISMLVE